MKTLPLFGRRLIEEFRQIDVKDLEEEEFRISDASSYSLFYRKLRKDKFRDNEEQTHVFEIDWKQFDESDDPKIPWDPGSLINKLSNENRERFYEELEDYFERGLWSRNEEPTIQPTVVYFPVVQERKNDKSSTST